MFCHKVKYSINEYWYLTLFNVSAITISAQISIPYSRTFLQGGHHKTMDIIRGIEQYFNIELSIPVEAKLYFWYGFDPKLPLRLGLIIQANKISQNLSIAPNNKLPRCKKINLILGQMHLLMNSYLKNDWFEWDEIQKNCHATSNSFLTSSVQKKDDMNEKMVGANSNIIIK